MSGDEIEADGIASARLRSVAQVLGDGRPASADAVALAAGAASEIAALHAAGQVHGHLDPETVLVDDAGAVVLGGPRPRRVGPAAPPELRSADRRAVGRILALGLGWPLPDRELPAPIEDLLARAEAAGTPSTALAHALRRIQHDPALVATLLPPVVEAVAARPREDRGPLASLVPRSARRTASLAAGVVAGAALVGGALLLIGTPGGVLPAPDSTGRAVAAPRAPATAAPWKDLAAIRPDSSSLDRLLRASRTAAPRPVVPSPARVATPARPAAPVAPTAPSTRSSGSAGPSRAPSPPAPAPSAPASITPSAPAQTPPASTAPPSPVPSPPHVPPSAPPTPAPSAPARRAAQRTTSATPSATD